MCCCGVDIRSELMAIYFSTGILTRGLGGALLGRGMNASLLLPSLAAANTVQPCRGMAARKGTREKARKKKVKIEIKKVVFDPLSQRDKKFVKVIIKECQPKLIIFVQEPNGVQTKNGQ
jgi:hypothetical protein